MFFDDEDMGMGSDAAQAPATDMPATDMPAEHEAAADSGENHEEAPADHEAAM